MEGDKHKFSIIKKFFQSYAFIVLGILILILVFVALFQEFVRRYQINKDIAFLKSQIGSLQTDINKLNGDVRYFDSESYLEKIARTMFNFSKEGENIVVVTDNSVQADKEQTIANLIKQDEEAIAKWKNPDKWWNYFMSVKR